MEFFGFGNLSDASPTISSHTPIDSSCSGTSGTKTLTATNPSFSANQMILVIQMRGTNAGKCEINQIASYVAGTITTVNDLKNTYTDGGANQAQVIVIPQYDSPVFNCTVKAWNGDVGGVLVAMGETANLTSIVGTGKGYRGGAHGSTSYQGEGTDGAGAVSDSRNGNGAAGIASGGGSGGGGGNESSGNDGGGGSNNGEGGYGVGLADLSTGLFMGGGGSGGADPNSSDGGNGGAIIILIFRNFVFSGDIVTDGVQAGAANWPGGGGAGGTILLIGENCDYGSHLYARPGAARTGVGTSGAGANGRIRVEACSLSGSSTPGASEDEGGQSFCSGACGIL